MNKGVFRMQTRFIEKSFPLAINAEVKREKPAVMRTPASLHLWWARRPITLCRAVIAASLLSSPGEKFKEEMMARALLQGCSLKAGFESESQALKTLRELIQSNWSERKINLLDPFAGGGSIPLEGLRLGLNVYSSDLNPVSFLIRECGGRLIPQYQNETSMSKALEEEVRIWAERIELKAKYRLNSPSNPDSDVFGQEGVISYIWAKTGHCISCGLKIPLLSLTKLRMRKKERIYIGIDVDEEKGRFQLFPTTSGPVKSFLSKNQLFCPFCQQNTTTLADIKEQIVNSEKTLGMAPIAKIMPSNGRSPRKLLPVDGKDLEYVQKAKEILKREKKLEKWPKIFPNEKAPPEAALGCITAAYGMHSFEDFFSPRQALVLATFAEEAIFARDLIIKSNFDPKKAKTIILPLAFALDRLADYNSLLTSWHVSKQITRNTFPAAQLRMTWDFVEANPFTPGSGSWASTIRTTIAGIKACSGHFPGQFISNQIGSATKLPYSTNKMDLVVTDPPYYDNMTYSYLSDFFYVWLKRTVGAIYPEVFCSVLTPKEEELIVSGSCQKEREKSHRLLEGGLMRSFQEVHRVLKPGGLMIVMYTHSSMRAWSQLIRCIRAANFKVTAAWPISSELRTKIASSRANILVSIILVCRPKEDASIQEIADQSELLTNLRDQVKKRTRAFAEHFTDLDFSTAMIAPALEVYSTIPLLQDPDGRFLEYIYSKSLQFSGGHHPEA
jgi:adenine-specific DNA methylase